MKLKQMGVKSGVSDLCLPYPKGKYCGLYIEMKYGQGRHQESQKEFLTDMAAAGHYVATCYTAEDAIQVLTEYCSLPKATVLKLSPIAEPVKLPAYQGMKEANNSIWKEGTVTQPKWR